MKIIVFGATGAVGGRVLAEALSRGHKVTAVVRNPDALKKLPAGINAKIGHADNAKDVAALSVGHDVAISATRPPEGQEQELVITAKALLKGLGRTGVRLLLVGGAASLTVPDQPETLVIDDLRYILPAWRPIAQACADQLEVCRKETKANWTYLSPPASLTPGKRTGKYRIGKDELLVDGKGQSCISMEDFSVALLDEAENPKHHQTRFTVASSGWRRWWERNQHRFQAKQ